MEKKTSCLRKEVIHHIERDASSHTLISTSKMGATRAEDFAKTNGTGEAITLKGTLIVAWKVLHCFKVLELKYED